MFPSVIHALVGQCNEVARTNAGFDRDEQTTCGSFEDRDSDNVSDPKSEGRRRTPIGKDVREPWIVRSKDVHNFGRQPDSCIGKCIGLGSMRPHVNATRPKAWQEGVAASPRSLESRSRQQSSALHKIRAHSP